MENIFISLEKERQTRGRRKPSVRKTGTRMKKVVISVLVVLAAVSLSQLLT